ncbi:MAG: hypothetical protein HKN85_13020, partial [Gammaproteobacteria bacterium]|nr:hypothetical protein [Gammaproteobacteria bacterium]
ATGYNFAHLKTQVNVLQEEMPEDSVSGLMERENGEKHHLTPLVHPNFPALIELHFDVVAQRGTQIIFDADECFSSARRGPVDLVCTLSHENRLLHCFYHSQIVDRNSYLGRIDLMQMYEFAQIIKRYGGQIDWAEIRTVTSRYGIAHQFNAYLKLTAIYFNAPLPSVYKASSISKTIVRNQLLFSRFKLIGAMASLVVFFFIKLYRQVSPRRVLAKYANSSPLKSYTMHFIETGKTLVHLGWLKPTLNQLIDAIKR